MKPAFYQVREALEASWDEHTSYLAVSDPTNPALGQCYPTSRVMQHFFPEMDIVRGVVWTGYREETHFWNILVGEDATYHIDLSWQQFPKGSVVRSYEVLDRHDLGDGEEMRRRCDLLLRRVTRHLEAVSAWL